MPCLILTGHPCVGKTTLAQLIKQRVEEGRSKPDRNSNDESADGAVSSLQQLHHNNSTRGNNTLWGIDNVVIVNEESACPGRTKAQCYADSASEKATRAALKSEFDRQVAAAGAAASSSPSTSSNNSNNNSSSNATTNNNGTLVICDSMNYIKGFRYELHCISKAAGQRHGVLWVLNSVQVANAWNDRRKSDEAPYLPPTLMEELRQRYEPPDVRNRWDQPLFTIDMSIYLPNLQQQQEINGTTTSAQPFNNNIDNNNNVPTTSNDLAQDALHRSVYNMHALRDAFGSDAEASNPTTPTPAVKQSTVKRAGFRRATGPSSQSNAATTTTTTTPREPLPSQNTPHKVKHEESTPTNNQEASIATTTTNTSEQPQQPISLATSIEERVDEILESFLCKNVQPLKEGASTRVHVYANANVLHKVDTVTHQVLHAISAQLSSSLSSSSPPPSTTTANGKVVVLPQFGLSLSRCPNPSELYRLRQQYLRWVATYPPEDTSERGIAASFLSYIEAAQPQL